MTMTENTAADTTGPRIAGGPYTNRSNANRAMKRIDKHGARDLYVSDENTGGEQYWVMERVVDADTEAPNGTPALDLPVKDRISAGLRGDLAQNAEGVLVVDRKGKGPTADPGTVTPATPHGTTRVTLADSDVQPDVPEGADVIEKRVRCGAGTVTYTHRVKDGSAFVYGRWVADPADPDTDVVTFARGAGWWKNGRRLDGVTTLAGAFEA
jgi:hypothetical protein